ncbi:MAG TPA: hypothetical protein DCG57_16305, partial [Candidatus Riflebacteria bacterium]|nr:hypothetical protein [Candidatus Riflebacteria bacterium]
MEAHLMLNDHRKSLQKFALVFVLVNFISSALLAQTENSPTTAVDVTEQAAQIAKTADYQFMTDDHSSATDMYSETPDEQNASDAVSVSDMSAYTIVASDSTEIATTLTIDEFWAQQASMSKISEIGSGPIQLLDTHIGDILRLALLRNRTIIGSEQQVESANAGVIQARSAHGAKLTGNFRYTRVDDVANPLVGKDSRNTYL